MIMEAITIDWLSLIIGAGSVIVLVLIYTLMRSIRKPKHDLHNLKALVYETGIKTNEVYKNIKELEKVFQEIEG